MSELQEFKNFLNSDTAVPAELSTNILKRVQALLNPSAFSIFTKIFGIHVVVGTVSLAFCHQFDLNPFNTELSLSDWFMRVGGHGLCMIGCGVFFTGFSILAAGYFLTAEEIKVLRRTEILQALSLSMISLGAFAFFGAELALTLGGLWLLGSMIGGFVATETVWRLKTH